MERLLTVAMVIAIGVGGVMLLFWALNWIVERLPIQEQERYKPYVFIAPALLILGVFVIFPTVQTIYLSFFDARSANFVGIENYRRVASDRGMLVVLRNNLMWLVVVPPLIVCVGLIVATLADRLTGRWESISKSVVFLPMAISFVGASTIWLFVYAFQPLPRPQVGLLNELRVQLGMDPIGWLSTQPWNNFMLMLIMIWMQAGFAMVLLSAAIKNVPTETLEAARIDGANELQIFFRVVIPQIKTTIFVVTTIFVILVLKIFDVVYVTTNGLYGTDVVARRFISELYTARNYGTAATLVVVLLVATIPFMIINVRRFREQEAVR